MKESIPRPSEVLEAQEQKEKHDSGLEQANFYRKFLDTFKSDVLSKVQESGVFGKYSESNAGREDPMTTIVKLKEFTLCTPDHLAVYINSDANKANRDLGTSETVNYNVEELADLTPSEFVKKIEELKSTLVKE